MRSEMADRLEGNVEVSTGDILLSNKTCYASSIEDFAEKVRVQRLYKLLR